MDFPSVESAFEEAVSQGVFPGAVVLVSKDEEIVYENAFGYRSLIPEKTALIEYHLRSGFPDQAVGDHGGDYAADWWEEDPPRRLSDAFHSDFWCFRQTPLNRSSALESLLRVACLETVL